MTLSEYRDLVKKGEVDVTYEDYQLLMKEQIKSADVREICFQENVFRPFLEILFPEYDVVPVDTKISTRIHDYTQYCGTYENSAGKATPTTPDLCIAKDWNWDNRNHKVDYKCVIEVKSPFLKKRTGFEPQEWPKEMQDQIQRHLKAEQNHKVILTDGVTWVFYDNTDKAADVTKPNAMICLGKLEYKMQKGQRKKEIPERAADGDPIVKDIRWNDDEGKAFESLKEKLYFVIR